MFEKDYCNYFYIWYKKNIFEWCILKNKNYLFLIEKKDMN